MKGRMKGRHLTAYQVSLLESVRNGQLKPRRYQDNEGITRFHPNIGDLQLLYDACFLQPAAWARPKRGFYLELTTKAKQCLRDRERPKFYTLGKKGDHER